MTQFQPIVEECQGCSKVVDGHCRAYTNPKAKWRPMFGNPGWCNHCNIPKENMTEEQIKRNPLKESKMKRRGRAWTGRPYSPHVIGRNKGMGKKRYIAYADGPAPGRKKGISKRKGR